MSSESVAAPPLRPNFRCPPRFGSWARAWVVNNVPDAATVNPASAVPVRTSRRFSVVTTVRFFGKRQLNFVMLISPCLRRDKPHAFSSFFQSYI